jgi:DNA-binding transcriptional regulator LsrR (DeoR family)
MPDLKIEHKIARLYYLEGFSQSAIAKKLSISVASVSRALARAKDAGIVQITIAEPTDDFSGLETRLEKRFDIKECIITPSYEQEETSRRAMVGALADMLPRILPMHGTLGVSWGETMKAIADGLSLPTPLEADVIPMVGAMGTVETGIYPNAIARVFAEKLGGRAFLVNAPAVNDRKEMTEDLYRSRSFSSVREIWERIDVALVGCSGIGLEASMARNSIFTPDDMEALRSEGAVAAMNFSFLNGEGLPVHGDVADRILHIPLDQMKSFEHVVLIASGRAKVDAIRAALTGGWITSLISDVDTATLI